jgi:chloramphenicol-sensitive protein RarD
MTNTTEQGLDRSGVTAALAAFVFWGLVPIYYKGLATVGAWEVLAHRVIWSVPVLLLFLLIRDGKQFWKRLRLPLKSIAWLFFSGLLRKRMDVGPMLGLLWETALMFVPALLCLLWLSSQSRQNFLQVSTGIDLLLVGSSRVTVLPLIWFNMAAQKLPLSILGFFQYIAPSMSFMLAVFLYGERFTFGHAVAFGCIWLALALVSIEPFRRARKRLSV